MIKEQRTAAKYKGRVIVIKADATHVYLRPLGKQWNASGVKVAIVDVFKLGKKQKGIAKAREKVAVRRALRKLRRAAKLGDDGDGVNVLTEREMFLLAHLGRSNA